MTLLSFVSGDNPWNNLPNLPPARGHQPNKSRTYFDELFITPGRKHNQSKYNTKDADELYKRHQYYESVRGRNEPAAVYSASVTLTARMASEHSDSAYGDQDFLPGPHWHGSDSTAAWWRITSERLPLLVGVFCGGFLITILLLAVIVYRCCIMPRGHKHFCK